MRFEENFIYLGEMRLEPMVLPIHVYTYGFKNRIELVGSTRN